MPTDENPESLDVRIITRPDEFNSLSEAWQELINNCTYATPFQSPGWLIPWWKHFGNDRLWTIAVFHGQRLVGLAPLYIFDYHNHRQVTFIGTGNTDYLDILLYKGMEQLVLDKILAYSAEHASEWDFFDLQGLLKASLLLNTPMPPGLKSAVNMQEVCPVTELPGSIDAFLSMLGSSFRKNIQRAIKMLKASGTLTLDCADNFNLDVYLEQLFLLHKASWQQRSINKGVLEDTVVQDFHKDAARELLGNKLLCLYALKHNGRIAATVYSLHLKKRLYFYIGGFDPELSKYSPGSVCIFMIIEKAIGDGIKEFDFLEGAEPYKYHWGAVNRNSYRLNITKTHIKDNP